MDNPFKKLIHHEEVPKVLKERVINDIALIKLSIDMADLFAIKYPGVVTNFTKGTPKNKNDKKKNSNNN